MKPANRYEVIALSKDTCPELHPMAISLITLKYQELLELHGYVKQDGFVAVAYKLLSGDISNLTPKWVYSINTWCDTIIAGTQIQSPTYKVGDSIDLSTLKILKIVRGNYFNHIRYFILEDDTGWRYFISFSTANIIAICKIDFRSSKQNIRKESGKILKKFKALKRGDKLWFDASVRKITDDGLTFLDSKSSHKPSHRSVK